LIGTVAAGWFLGRASRQIFYIATILGIIYLLDFYVPKPLPVADESHSGKTVVITGANSGVGFETARQLAVTYGARLVLGCRSKPKCDAAEKTINEEVALSKKDGKATALFIDLDSFESVNSFVKQLQGMDIDVLFNNAGYVPVANLPVNKYGLDPSFTSMHLSHFLLTEELIKTHPSLRVVTTSSIGQQFCAMSFHVPKFVLSASQLIPLPKFITSTFYLDHSPGCINASYLKNNITTPTNDLAYMHAKMANLMHAIEIPVHRPQATSVAVDLGFVSTGILSLMQGTISPMALGWMRHASLGVLPMIHAILYQLMKNSYRVISKTKGYGKREVSSLILLVQLRRHSLTRGGTIR
jgi:NAD(P)-dependent dehydrogenase (short-subunit alcohol dehydrogenase family)